MADTRVDHSSEHLEYAASTMSPVMQLFSLEGQTVLATGGTRGIGQSMAIALAQAGADILLVQVGMTTFPSSSSDAQC